MTASLEGWLTKAKKVASPYEVRLAPLDTNQVFQILRVFLLYMNDFPDDVICNIGNYAGDTTLYSKSDQASDLWQQLELVYKLESDL